MLFSLPTLIALSKKDLVDLVMVTGVRQSYSEPHPLGDIRLSPEWAEKLKPLLEAQPYLNTVSVIDQAEFQGCYDGAPVVNLDQFRRLEIDPSGGPAQRWFLWAHAEHFDLTLPTLTVRPDLALADSWLVNRTSRNRNPFIDWRTLADLPCVFVGLPEEYESLRRLLPNLRHHEVSDFLQLASLLAGARGFVGNQSFCFALAESLKVPRLLETPLSHANVFPVGGQAFEARTPMAWASALEELTQSRKRLDYEVKRPLPKVFFHQQDLTACSLYRATMPAHYLAHLLTGRVTCDLGPALAIDNDYKAINLQRVVKGNFLTALRRFQAQGKLFLWDTDDLFTALPESNPAYRDVDEAVKEHLEEVAELADWITVTTPYLKEQLGHPGKTVVLPNLLDPHLYPPVQRDPGRTFTRILWAGSPSHDADLAQLEPVYHLLKERYGDRVQWVFMGYWPTWACDYERRPGESVARLASRYKDVGFVRPVPLGRYPAALCDLAPDVAVCPLADCVFNRCKCVTGDTLVVTAAGVKEMASIQGGKVVLEDGRRRAVVGEVCYPDEPTIRLRTKRGYTIEGTPRHQIKNSLGEWKELSSFGAGDWVMLSPFKIVQKDYQWFPYPLLLTKCVRDDLFRCGDPDMMPRIVFNERWGRLLGLLFGDGCLHKGAAVSLSCSLDYPDMIEEAKRLFQAIGMRPHASRKRNHHKPGSPEVGKGVGVAASSRTLVDVFHALGFVGARGKVFAIPPLILQSPKSVVREFLRGLFEADGTVSLDGGVSFVSKSQKLASQVHVLLLGFGIISRLAPRFNKHHQKHYYQVCLGRQAMQVFAEEIGFLSEKKTAKLAERLAKPHSNAYRAWRWADMVVAVEPSRADVYDIEVSKDHYYLGNGFVSHNSGIKAQEMTMAGAAVVASPLEPYGHLRPGRTGLFATENPAAWVQQLSLLIENPGLRAELQAAALAQVHAEFSWWSEGAVKPWVEFYSRLAAGGDLHRADRLCETEPVT